MIANSVIEWLNENEYRGYPLRENTPRAIGETGLILDPVLLDASFVFVANPMPITTKLMSLTVTNTIVTFVVTNQPAFVFDKTTVSYPHYMRNAEGSLLVLGEVVRYIPNGTYTFPNTCFEDTVSCEMRNEWLGVQSLNFPSYVLTGIVEWYGAYQFDISVESSTILMNAGSNYGTPLSGETFFEDVADYDCAEVVSFINGATPSNNPDTMSFIPGQNIRIFDDPANHRIYIGLNFEKEDVCQTSITNPSL